MISLISGTLRSLTLDRAVVDVSGVGYLLLITPRTSAQLVLGGEVTFFTTLVVREDAMTLFAFLDSSERDTFEILQTVSGIGPKVALAITGSLTSDDLARAVAQEDFTTIEKVPGIGKKGAQRLVLELKGKIHTSSNESKIPVVQSGIRDQLLAALTGLGFSPKDSDAAITSTFALLSESSTDPSQIEISELLRLALQSGRR
jgi:Holliday junction DNA helicase RuvA